EVVKTLCRITDELTGLENSENLIEFVKDRPGHDMRYAIDASKINNELGWTPAHKFDQGIRKTVEWYLSNKEWIRKVQSGEYREYFKKQYGMTL
ncbi:MAG: GDP-mannose 4,6-dehydratase, partial [Candidatus Muiribacteriota bacterium]